MKIDKLYEKLEQAEKEPYKIRKTYNQTLTEKEHSDIQKEIYRREEEIEKLQDKLLKIEKQLFDELDTHGENQELYGKFNNLQKEIDNLNEELDEVDMCDEEKEAYKKIFGLQDKINEIIGTEIIETEKELEQTDDNDDEKIDALRSRLESLDPYNDMFHLGCRNWPNCEEVGCGEY